MIILRSLGRAGVRLIDYLLDFHYKPQIFSDDPSCLLRISPAKAPHAIDLSDGTKIAKGDPLIALHFWNDRIGKWAKTEKNFGVIILAGGRASLRQLAAYLQEHPEYDNAKAIFGDLGFITDRRMEDGGRTFAARIGFDLMVRAPAGWYPFRVTFWQNIFSWWMMWSVNPRSIEKIKFGQLQRCELWMSRSRLLERYGSADSVNDQTA